MQLPVPYLSRKLLTKKNITAFSKSTLQTKLGGALGKTPLNPIHIWVKHVLPKIFWA